MEYEWHCFSCRKSERVSRAEASVPLSHKLMLVSVFASLFLCLSLHTYLCDGQTQTACTVKLCVDSLPDYLDSRWTAAIGFGKISVFSFWPPQQSCPCCRSTSELFSLTKLAKALPAPRGLQCRGSAGKSRAKKKIGDDLSGETEKC